MPRLGLVNVLSEKLNFTNIKNIAVRFSGFIDNQTMLE